MLSGGSLASWSVTNAALTWTVTVSPCAKSVSGSTVHVDGPPFTTNVWFPVPEPVTGKDCLVAFTASENVTPIVLVTATLMALSTGSVVETDGAASPPQG